MLCYATGRSHHSDAKLLDQFINQRLQLGDLLQLLQCRWHAESIPSALQDEFLDRVVLEDLPVDGNGMSHQAHTDGTEEVVCAILDKALQIDIHYVILLRRDLFQSDDFQETI